ncbi:response regulator [Idiomarina xiamenensis]|uniref:Response regulator receiver protein n=1 Tax=Idiomarina xiamenensis 10-D-4 TaxID=740709 RepID=K2KLY4_9GAMM|nr:response regulator [Idiomarina xiamenensis]EKE87562.1 response regulator receiver protein [Idiomarina xiamenensis 10-D-4]
MMTALTRILYVEDEPDIREVASMALQALGGYQICCCESAQQALTKGPAFAPQLLLLDVMMPGMDGPQLLQQWRQLSGQARVPVIFMTAKVQPKEVEELKQLGALAVISKPFDPMQLAAQIETIWKQV